MLKAISLVLALLILGNTVVDAAGLPFPGAVIGLIALAFYFFWNGDLDLRTARLFDAISPVFPMFFVPAAVGIVANVAMLSSAWLHVATAITLGTATTIAATGLIAQALLRRTRHAHKA
jgi:holin-like protein